MKQQSSENVGSNTTDPEVNQQRSEIYKHRCGETLTTVCLFRGSLWLQDFTTTCSETSRAHFGPTPQRVHLGRSSAQLVAVNLVMENQTSVARFESARWKSHERHSKPARCLTSAHLASNHVKWKGDCSIVVSQPGEGRLDDVCVKRPRHDDASD